MTKDPEFNKYIEEFEDHIVSKNTMVSNVGHRFRSFDFCWHYFRSNIGNVAGARTEESCMRLWAYLASWGMLRGSSELLQHNPRSLIPLIEYINRVDRGFWDIDVNDYPNKKEAILEVYNNIHSIIAAIPATPTVTLVTKIMLGVFGNFPAFDQYFTKAFKVWLNANGLKLPRGINHSTIEHLHEFYKTHQAEIDSHSAIRVVDFDGIDTRLTYYRAKLIDMWGFIKGFSL